MILPYNIKSEYKSPEVRRREYVESEGIKKHAIKCMKNRLKRKSKKGK